MLFNFTLHWKSLLHQFFFKLNLIHYFFLLGFCFTGRIFFNNFHTINLKLYSMNTFLPKTKKLSLIVIVTKTACLHLWNFMMEIFTTVFLLVILDILTCYFLNILLLAEHHVMAAFYSDAFKAGIVVWEKWTIVCSSRNKMYFFIFQYSFFD